LFCNVLCAIALCSPTKTSNSTPTPPDLVTSRRAIWPPVAAPRAWCTTSPQPTPSKGSWLSDLFSRSIHV
jgi:hypothetical protein